MRVLALPLLLCLAAPAAAQSVYETLGSGTFGSVNDPATSCAANPHRVEFMAQPPHAFLTWALPWDDPDGGPTSVARYDIEAADATSLTLRREGSGLRADTGGPILWVLRLTTDPVGYCWGRSDRPSVFCERQQMRCSDTAPTS